MSHSNILVRVENLTKHFPINRGIFIQRQVGATQAVDNISFDIHSGETLGLVGESGSGKSTTALCILQLHVPTSGKVFFRDLDLTTLKADELRQQRKHMQIIFQDPYASLDPRIPIGETIAEPLRAYRDHTAAERRKRVEELMDKVGLDTRFANRYPHEFSGGQRQRVGIARALALDPDLIICDEPISALDVSIQAQVVNLLEELQRELGLTYLFIAHDLSMIHHISDRIAVMYLGKLVEVASRDNLFHTPLHPYTKALLSAVPIPDPPKERQRKPIVLTGDIPSPANPPSGCRFRTRCVYAEDRCAQEAPEWGQFTPGHWVACHLAADIQAGLKTAASGSQ